MRFYLVDKITELQKGLFIRGIKNVSMTEPFFTYHFPRYPVMPGVLIVEAMAQAAGLLVELSLPQENYRKAILSIVDKVKFRFMVRPGDQIILEATIENLSETGACCTVSARVEERVLAETMLTFSLQDVRGIYDSFQDGERQSLLKTLLRDVDLTDTDERNC
ncbi:MAG: 3-hydroxyacyl-[acyl-carrier-protein] dehydratase FabZ [Candidatus Wallbacteria bacterium HGW-Wallbacteria-1]|jgi:beta-hydroxyacyl-ACP dehydratase FabZ|uniref:3-hydroxyacyl-[acyl-carrier-protein] dehydratase FabZ n=1 Tax=Candidatus Wallbacteria bacterium HGW-Wallbacteria-1 TaxID=2013854 RepID=A0A2N1PPP4_9BACT|nr:MAG: 3-hydroxyacyl-[acyl-carrier-protein] dehydratase FabZ [Candidatus Wallbacteria bacterium HGW-Wallbacteria-1]